jgi:hypothetical protein
MNKNGNGHDLDLKVNINIKAIDNVTGEIKDERDIHNIIVTTGKSRIAQLINGVSTNFFEYVAIGIGTTSPVVGDTELETEQKRELASTSEDPSGTAKWVNVFTFSSGESFSITEVGILDQLTASGSVMMNRSTFGAIAVDSDTDLSITITVAVDNCP